MLLPSHSLSYLRSCGCQVKTLVSVNRNIDLFSKEERKEDLGNYRLPQQPIVGCLCLGRAWSRSSWKKR